VACVAFVGEEAWCWVLGSGSGGRSICGKEADGVAKVRCQVGPWWGIVLVGEKGGRGRGGVGFRQWAARVTTVRGRLCSGVTS